MEDRAKLVYFLNTLKEELGFKDSMDFKNKIENNFQFRFKVQKFVFLAKYFGWNNHYKFTLYPRGPYSRTLAKDYYSNIPNSFVLTEGNFKKDSFKEFVKGKSEYELEATSTILFYKSFNEDFTLENAIITLNEVKPHIITSIVEKSYLEVINFPQIKNIPANSFSNVFLRNTKMELLDKIINLKQSFGKFNESSNLDFTMDCLNYLKLILQQELLDKPIEYDLLEFISSHVAEIEKLYSFSINAINLFHRFDMSFLNDSFNQLQDYIAQELSMTPNLELEKIDETSISNKIVLNESINPFEEFDPLDPRAIRFDDLFGFHIILDDSSNEMSQKSLKTIKEDLIVKIDYFIKLSSNFESTYNSSLIVSFLEYLRIILREKNISLENEEKILNLISSYINEIEKIFMIANGDYDVFKQMNLHIYKVFFYRLHNYIHHMMEWVPTNDDEDLDYKLNYYSYYNQIHDFILEELIPEYDSLESCMRKNYDDEGNPAVEFLVYYNGQLTYSQRNALNDKIIHDFYEFCNASGFPIAFYDVSIFLIQNR